MGVTTPIRGAKWIHRSNSRESFGPDDISLLANREAESPAFRTELLRLGVGFFSQLVADRSGQTLDDTLIVSTGDDASLIYVASPWSQDITHWDPSGDPQWQHDDDRDQIWSELCGLASQYSLLERQNIASNVTQLVATTADLDVQWVDAAAISLDCTIGIDAATDLLRAVTATIRPSRGGLFVVLRHVEASAGKLDGISVSGLLGTWGVPQVRVRQLNSSVRFGSRKDAPSERIVVVSARL